MSEGTKFEIADGLNRVEVSVLGYTLALNAGDVYETDDVAELAALNLNDYVQASSKPATRSFAPFAAPKDDPDAQGAPPNAYIAPLTDAELKKARKGDSGGNQGGAE